MPENLNCSSQKANSKKFDKGYKKIHWKNIYGVMTVPKSVVEATYSKITEKYIREDK